MRSFPAFPRTTDAILKPPDADRLSALDDHHLLSLLLGRNAAVSPVSVEALFDRFGDLGAIASADLPELARTSGLGAAALTDLKLCRQLSERLVRCEAARRSVISSWTALLAYVKVALTPQSLGTSAPSRRSVEPPRPRPPSASRIRSSRRRGRSTRVIASIRRADGPAGRHPRSSTTACAPSSPSIRTSRSTKPPPYS